MNPKLKIAAPIFVVLLFVLIYYFTKRKKTTLAGIPLEYLREEFFSFDFYLKDKDTQRVNRYNREFYGYWTDFFSPFDDRDKSTFNKLIDAKSGVYLIKDDLLNEIVYIGFSGSQLFKTIYRHFYEYRQNNTRVYFPRQMRPQIKIAVCLCEPDNAWILEKYLIFMDKRLVNTNKYEILNNDYEIVSNYDIQLPDANVPDGYEEFAPINFDMYSGNYFQLEKETTKGSNEFIAVQVYYDVNKNLFVFQDKKTMKPKKLTDLIKYSVYKLNESPF